MADPKSAAIDALISVALMQARMIDSLSVTVRAMRLALIEEKSLSVHLLNRKQREIENDEQSKAQMRAIQALLEELLDKPQGPIQ